MGPASIFDLTPGQYVVSDSGRLFIAFYYPLSTAQPFDRSRNLVLKYVYITYRRYIKSPDASGIVVAEGLGTYGIASFYAIRESKTQHWIAELQ